MLKKLIYASFFGIAALPALTKGQTHTSTFSGVKISAEKMEVNVQFYSPAIVRVTKSPINHNFKKQSLSVIKVPEKVKIISGNLNNELYFKSSKIIVFIDRNTGRVRFSELNGKKLLTEKDRGTNFSSVQDNGHETYDVKQSFTLDTAEALYGLGQLQNGKLSQRNQKVLLKQENTRVSIPFIQSSKGYGVFWDNYSPTTFEDTPQETSFDSQRGDCSDYYFMYGGNVDGVVAKMRELTGQAPMKPLWAYGFIQSRERYKTQFELMDVVKKYRALNIPLDGIVQDWQYWGPDSNWNAMAFDKKTYPRPQAMIDSVHQQNAHLFIVSWPGFGPKTQQYAEFKEKNMLIDFDTWPPKGGAKPYDVYNPKARSIYWNYLNKGIFSLGPDAWWLDSTEPDHINIKESDWYQQTYLGTYLNWLNAFPLEHTSGVYNNQRLTSDRKRVVLLTRSAFAGQQRNGSDTWSGDLGSNWGNLKRQIPAVLNFGMTGLPYWNVDIGGFFAGAFVKDGGAKNPEFQKLYVRWMQFSTFTSMMRSHGTDIPREIYQFGNKGDWAFDVQEKYINLRYKLLPYIYSVGWNVTHNSGSFIRPLLADYPNDRKVRNLSSEFLLGKSLLISPVTDKDVQDQQVYLPAGYWYDFWTGEKIAGNKMIDKKTPIDVIPFFVKAGTIIPWGPSVQYALEKKWDKLDIRIYPGADGDFTLYEDENDNYNYEKQKYSEITFHWNDKAKTLTIDSRRGGFEGMLTNRKFNVDISPVGAENAAKGKIVSYTGTKTTVKL
ncbi:alpha-D-xyloside xylohydrolase [Mucilaginibacter gracilis]|uniref:Alpha-D-xyloside xylohydrolase n=1 Tax=Mucilaginibacter gracilis TaxID=423350 RepID=A0A495IUW4_9SPHI|nr:TIM-barrel domain-containing protein [Mucilaginibacter gracilis]RKR80546.1 alpha-D-xyloside xylohydrolase [Mucilaginibacter gracilis]